MGRITIIYKSLRNNVVVWKAFGRSSVTFRVYGEFIRTMSSSLESPRYKCGKRNDYLSWENYFMATALLAAQRSKDPRTQVGACIVNNDNIILGIGYNGFPKGCSDDAFSWARRKTSPQDNKHLYVCHAEVNAILNKNSTDTKGCKMYVTLFPCNECAKFIIQSGIKEIFYLWDTKHWKTEYVAAKKMFDAAGVKYSEFKTKLEVKVYDQDGQEDSDSPPTKKPYGGTNNFHNNTI